MRPLVLVRLAQLRQTRRGCTLREAALSLATHVELQRAMWRIFWPSRRWR